MKLRRHVGLLIGIAVLYTGVLVTFLWPWPLAPGRLGIYNHDLLLHAWSMAWVVRQVVADPAHLFDANMFWPQPGALSYTETLFPQSLMAAPILWAGGGPLLAHNLVLFASVVLSGVTAAVLALRLTGSGGAAAVAGFAYAFAPFRFHHLVQMGVASYQWFPLVLLALWNLAASPRSRGSVYLLGAACVVQALSSGYHAVLLGFVVASILAFFARRFWSRGKLTQVAVPLAIAALVLVWTGAPSVRLRERQAVTRGVEELIHWSAVPRSYLDPGSSVGALGLSRVVERTAEPLFPGITASILAMAGALISSNRVARRMFFVLGIVCASMAAGPVLRDLPLEPPGPFELVRRLPPADMIRGPSRFGIGAVLAIDMLAALGFAAILRRIRPTRRPPLIAATLAFMAIEMRPSIGASVQTIPPPPPYTSLLARLPHGPVLELPWEEEASAGLQLYWSTAHWQPLLAGYGGFSVPANFQVAAMARNFPTGFTSRVARCAGIRYVVVHGASVSGAQYARARGLEPEGVTRLGQFGSDFVFELQPWNSSVGCDPAMPRDFRRP